LKIFQKGFNFGQDGPGNRLVLHLQGCPMQCPWCANPESMAAEALPPFTCKEYTVRELVEEAVRSKAMFFGGGGVTLTGGEPTAQFDEVQELLQALKAEGIHTAMETNGTHKRLPELFDIVDWLIMDFKHPDSAVHKQYTGVPNDIIKENLLQSMSRQVLVRILLLNNINTSNADLEVYLNFFSHTQNPLLQIEFLRYHEFGKQKWGRLGKPYLMDDTAFVSDEILCTFRTAFTNAGYQVINT